MNHSNLHHKRRILIDNYSISVTTLTCREWYPHLTVDPDAPQKKVHPPFLTTHLERYYFQQRQQEKEIRKIGKMKKLINLLLLADEEKS